MLLKCNINAAYKLSPSAPGAHTGTHVRSKSLIMTFMPTAIQRIEGQLDVLL